MDTNGTDDHIVTYVLGDIGGQVDIFRKSLESIGVDPDELVIPQGVRLVQVGDIVRMNESAHIDNLGALNISNQLKRNNEQSYVQLWGNHEYGAMNWRFPGAPWRINDANVAVITAAMKSWLNPEHAQIAFAVGNTLITHAGLSYGQWKSLGTPTTASAAADALNERTKQILARKGVRHGYILNRYTPAMDVDCLWAEAAMETYPSWIDGEDDLPFDQVHGHDTPYDHNYKRLKPHTSRSVATHLEVDRESRRTVLTVNGRTITCIDWMLSNHDHEASWQLLRL